MNNFMIYSDVSLIESIESIYEFVNENQTIQTNSECFIIVQKKRYHHEKGRSWLRIKVTFFGNIHPFVK